jgi:hypothetical protein
MSLLTFLYDESYFPAFPIVEIEIDGYDPASGRQTIAALVDSGADGTMIPLPTLQAVGAIFEDSMPLRGVTGHVQRVDRYTIAVRVGLHTIRAVHAVAVASDSEPIVGRDVLNELVVTLNGPAHTTEIHL